jgi:hypothetical protein
MSARARVIKTNQVQKKICLWYVCDTDTARTKSLIKASGSLSEKYLLISAFNSGKTLINHFLRLRSTQFEWVGL